MNTKFRLLWVLFFLTAAFAMAVETVVIIGMEESPDFAFLIARYLGVVLLLLSGVLACVSFLGRAVFGFAIATGLTFALFSLKLNFHESVLGIAAQAYWGGYIVINLALACLLMRKIRQGHTPPVSFFIVPALIFLSPVLLMPFHPSQEVASPTADSVFSRWRQIRLKEKPNIYLLSYDSLIPEDVAKDYLGIALPYSEAGKKYFTEIPNALSIKVPTVVSLNSVMRLDQKAQVLDKRYFSGRFPSILEQLLHANGYDVVMGYTSYYFGKKGRHIDAYLTPENSFPVEKTTLCIEQGNSLVMKMRGLYICDVFNALYRTGGTVFSILFYPKSATVDDDWHKRVISHIRETARKTKPTLSFFYIYTPIGHTPKNYNHNVPELRSVYKDYFIEKAHMANTQLAEIHAAISEHDPDSVVVVFGDHGAWLSRAADVNKDRHFYYRDRHRIWLGMMKTGNTCSTPSPAFSKHPYATPSRLVADILTCLAVKESVPEGLIDFDETETLIESALPKPVKKKTK